jgi:hypothetical protein
MLKNTWKTHPDYKNLEAAVDSVKATATYGNNFSTTVVKN